MNRNGIITLFFCTILILVLFVGAYAFFGRNRDTYELDVYVGIDAAYVDMTELKTRIDQVKDYTNMFVLGSTGITLDEIKLNEMSEYISACGLSFATYTHTAKNTSLDFNQQKWTEEAKQKWGNKFLGLYCYDEPGGYQIDRDPLFMIAREADLYSEATNIYVQGLHDYISEFIALNTTIMTSDYTLYEYDYRAGYDFVMAEYAWNHSRSINTALCRGSATMHNKEWGVMLTYTYEHTPYLASGPELYQDMVTAYENGAKYILVFDYAKDIETGKTYGILQQEHLDALKQFWEYVKTNSRPNNPVNERVAYVLPADFRYGFRGPDDSIWGIWKNSAISNQIWSDANIYAQKYGQKFDIIYADTPNFDKWAYNKLIYWNGTVQTKP
jgi:hypothetical protein